MFTGIIEALGKIEQIEADVSNLNFTISSPFAHELKIDQSVAHDGVCLTVTALSGNQYKVTAIEETLLKTNLKQWQTGQWVNLERAMPAGGRMDGHIVQGHVDMTAECLAIQEKNGSWEFRFSHEAGEYFCVPKGSVSVNGVSLTVVEASPSGFSVAIIPYTFAHTTFQYLKAGDRVNLEFDIIGKYIQRYLNAYRNHSN